VCHTKRVVDSNHITLSIKREREAAVDVIARSGSLDSRVGAWVGADRPFDEQLEGQFLVLRTKYFIFTGWSMVMF
jgi:hypothetical protein